MHLIFDKEYCVNKSFKILDISVFNFIKLNEISPFFINKILFIGARIYLSDKIVLIRIVIQVKYSFNDTIGLNDGRERATQINAEHIYNAL